MPRPNDCIDPATVRYVADKTKAGLNNAKVWLVCADGDLGLVLDAFQESPTASGVPALILAKRIERLERKLGVR